MVNCRQSRLIKTTPKFSSVNIMFVTTERKEGNFIKWENTSLGTPEALIKHLRSKRALELGKGSPAVAKTCHFILLLKGRRVISIYLT